MKLLVKLSPQIYVCINKLSDNIESLNVCQTKNKHQSICFTIMVKFYLEAV